MRGVLTLAALMLPLTTAAAAPAALESDQQAQKLANAIKDRVPGKPVDCVPLLRPRYNTEIVGDKILYRRNNRLVYVNQTSGGCNISPGLDILVFNNVSSQLCRGTIVRTFNPLAGQTTGGCTLGSFTPYTAAK